MALNRIQFMFIHAFAQLRLTAQVVERSPNYDIHNALLLGECDFVLCRWSDIHSHPCSCLNGDSVLAQTPRSRNAIELICSLRGFLSWLHEQFCVLARMNAQKLIERMFNVSIIAARTDWWWDFHSSNGKREMKTLKSAVLEHFSWNAFLLSYSFGVLRALHVVQWWRVDFDGIYISDTNWSWCRIISENCNYDQQSIWNCR